MVQKKLQKLSGISMHKDTAKELSGVIDEHLSMMPKFSGKEGFKSLKDWHTAVENDKLLNKVLTFGPVKKLIFSFVPRANLWEEYDAEVIATITAGDQTNNIRYDTQQYGNPNRTFRDTQGWETIHGDFETDEDKKKWVERTVKAYHKALHELIEKINKETEKRKTSIAKKPK